MKYILNTSYKPNTNVCIIYLKGMNLNVVTHNTKKFGRADGLQVEDWEVEA